MTILYLNARLLALLLTVCLTVNSCKPGKQSVHEGKDGYDHPGEAALFQKMRTMDLSTGEVPVSRMWEAVMETKSRKDDILSSNNLVSALNWTERGSNADVVGPSNGNYRANNAVTSGRIDAILVDKADATGKTVWIGGRGGGLWKTSDITVNPATWTPVNDYMINLSIAAITQDPTNTDIMYFCTGESFNEAGPLRGNGVFRSTDHGITWTQLSSTTGASFYYCTRILCDYLGNIYLGTRSGLYRSTKLSGGAAWTNITPNGVSTEVCDLEISSTTVAGRLHAMFGIGSAFYSRFTDFPTTVTPSTNWTSPVTAIPSTHTRGEMAVNGNTLYCLPSFNGQTPTVYKSTDGGANWTTAGSTPLTATGDPFANTQGWYNLAVAINPANSNECIIGGIDNAKTTNGGTTWTRISDWVGTSGQYVHADQHASIWYDNGNKLIFGSDGGIFYSANGGTTIRDRNTGLRLKQFYSVDIHPSSGSNYLIAGAQDNGTHTFSASGIGTSIEVFGGDGGHVAIDKDEPQFQVGAYVYANFRRSSNSGVNWSFGPGDNNGLFINPFDYDHVNNMVYASYSLGTYLRWTDPQAGFTYTSVPVAAFGGQRVGAVCVSPYNNGRAYFGMASGGKIIMVDGANAGSPTGVDKTGAGMPTGFVNCINTGSSDQFLVACYTNYGVSNIWVSTNNGANWTAVDGDLPDIPVYSAIFHPFNNNKMIIATETGVWETDLLNGSSTVWTPNTGFPTARTTMLKYRSSDRTLAASTYGRGLWTAVIPAVSTPDIQFAGTSSSVTELTTSTTGCRGYTDYTSNMQILNPPTGSATVTLAVSAGATATAGLDYVLSTNGNFTAPSQTLTFAGGATTQQPFTIRVYNDEVIESTENLTLTYTISGGSNAQAGSSNQSYSFTINDNDAAPISSGTFSNSVGVNEGELSFGTPFQGDQAKYRIQCLFSAAELTAAGINSARNFTSMTIRVVNKYSTQPFTNFTVSMANIATSSLVSGFISPVFTTVLPATSYTTATGNNLINFTTAFAWDGSSNVVMNFCFDRAAADFAPDDIEGSASPLGPGVYASTYTNNVASSPCTAAANYISENRIRATFGTEVLPTPVATALNSTKTAYLGPNQEIFYYDATGALLAKLKNQTAFDYGCTQITIDRAGTGATAFWNTTAANYLFSKSIKIVPTNTTSTGSYQLTLYYTPAEVTAWQTATGRTWSGSALAVVKSNSGVYIPDITAANPNAANVAMVTGTKGMQGTNYSIQGDFSNTGMSGFGVGIPANAMALADYRSLSTGNFATGSNWQYNNSEFGFTTANLAPGADNNINIQSGHVISLDANHTINTGKTLTLNGTLNGGTNTISGAGSFVMATGSSLGIGSAAGITASGATGNIQTTTRTFSTTGNYTYNGAVNQSTGNGLPATVNSLTIANTGAAGNNSVTMSGAITVSGVANFSSGKLAIGANALTLNGTVSGSATITGSSASDLNIGGSGALGTVNFDQTTDGTTNILNAMTVNRASSGTVSLGNKLVIIDRYIPTNGVLTTGGFLHLRSTAAKTARVGIGSMSGGYISGNVTVERYLPVPVIASVNKRTWRLLAIPTSGTQTVKQAWQEGATSQAQNLVPGYGTQLSSTSASWSAQGFDAQSAADHSMKIYDPVTGTYSGLTNTSNAIASANGYFIFVRGDRTAWPTNTLVTPTTLRTTGGLYQGNSIPAITVPADKFAMIGNPYASQISAKDIGRGANIPETFYVWDPLLPGTFGIGGFQTITQFDAGNYRVAPGGTANYNYTTTSNIPKADIRIESGQAFFVKATNASGANNVSFTEAIKTDGSRNMSRTSNATDENMSAVLYSGTGASRKLSDAAVVLYDNAYSNAVNDEDVVKFSNTDINFSAKRENRYLVFERRKIIGLTDTIYYNFAGAIQRDYEFEFQPNALNRAGLFAKLVDNYLDAETHIALDGSTTINFVVNSDPASAAADRFKLVYYTAGALPVTITNIKAAQQQAGIAVEWTVSNQLNMKHYDLERSADGVNFNSLAIVPASSSSNARYNWLDRGPVTGNNFYRVRAVGLNGDAKFSQVVKIAIGTGSPGIAVYPNPVVNRNLSLQFTNMPAGKYQLKLVNSSGQTVYEDKFNHAGNSALQVLKLPQGLGRGNYHLEIIKPGGKAWSKAILVTD